MNNSASTSMICPPGIDALGEPTAPHLRQPRPQSQNDFQHAAPTILATRGLKKSYRKGSITIPVLRGVNFEAGDGQFTAIVGQSGSGKSTLLHLMATLDAPDEGEIYYDGQRIDNLPAAGRDVLRNCHIGMIFQFYHLLPELSTFENVLLPMMIADSPWRYWRKKREHHDRARELLDLVGLGHRLRHRPRELSGGEMQRVAVARALMANPKILLADEPTGNLDRKTGDGVLDVLNQLNACHNLTIVMVTHDNSIARRTHCVVQLVEGQLEDTTSSGGLRSMATDR